MPIGHSSLDEIQLWRFRVVQRQNVNSLDAVDALQTIVIRTPIRTRISHEIDYKSSHINHIHTHYGIASAFNLPPLRNAFRSVG